jgi:MerR family redox-sensitive transcriptional activator SoxR
VTELLPIDRVAKRASVRASALRYYERVGLLPVAARAGGRRVYPLTVLDRLAVIQLAKRAGFTLAETRVLLRGLGGRKPAAERWRALARGKMAELDAQLADIGAMRRLLSALVTCACPSLEDCGRALAPALRERAPMPRRRGGRARDDA